MSVRLHHTESAWPARHIARAITLIEALCALAIAAIALGTLAGTLSLTARAMMESREAVRRARIVSGVERLLRRDFAQALRIAQKTAPAFVGRSTGLPGEPVLEFVTTNVPGSVENRGEPWRVAYLLEAAEGEPDTLQLKRRDVPYKPDRPIEQRPAERLAAGIKVWRAQFFDGTRWLEQWQRDHLPRAVRIEIAFTWDRVEGPPHTLFFAPLVSTDADPTPP